MNKRYSNNREQVSKNNKVEGHWADPFFDLFRVSWDLIKKWWKGSPKTFWEITFGTRSRGFATMILILLMLTPPLFASMWLVQGPLAIKSMNEVQAIPLIMSLNAYGSHPDAIKSPQMTDTRHNIYLFKENDQIFTKDSGAPLTEFVPVRYAGQYWDWPFDAGLEGIQFNVDHRASSGPSQLQYDRSYMIVDPDDSVSGVPNVKFETTPFWISDWEGNDVPRISPHK